MYILHAQLLVTLQVKLGEVQSEDVRGMRAPFLETGGDAQYRMMSEAGFEYDSSFMAGPYGSSGGAWPFTLDFPPTAPTYCDNLNCPRRPHPGVWQLPLNRWLGRFVIDRLVIPRRRSYTIRAVCLFVILSVSRIAHERVNGRRPNVVGKG